MHSTLVFFASLALFCGNAFGVKFPKNIPKCKIGDTDCIVKSTNLMIATYGSDGVRSINLLPLDPLEVPRIYIKQGADSPVNVELTFTNNKVFGIKDCEFFKIKGFDENIEGKYELRAKGPVVSLLGPYKISGKILILPISGEGQSNITIMNPELLVKFDGKKIEKNGKIYMKPENTKLSFTTTRIYMRFDNLYNGDKILGESTNLFLNENWNEVFPEIRKSVFDALSQIVEHYMANIFTKIPYNELFAAESK